MLPFRVVVKPYLRPDLAAAHPHPNSFSITLIQPLSFLTFTHSCHRDGGCTGNPISKPANLPTCLRPISFFFISLRTLLHFFALTKKTTPLFSIVSALFAKKHRGWGTPVSRARPFRRDYHAPNQSPACPDLVGVTNHQSPPWPSAPLRRTAFGATIRKGTRNLYDPGKQL